MNEINTALIALSGVLVGAYVNNFAAEDFRRFRDSQALAGALAGELASIQVTLPDLLSALNNMKAKVRANERLDLHEFPQPSSPIFEANTQRVGLLDPGLAREVAFVYERVRAFRVLFHHLSKYHVDMQSEGRESLIRGCIQLVDGGEEKIDSLVKRLDIHTEKQWRLPKIVRWGIALAILLGAVSVGFFFVPALHVFAPPSLMKILGQI